MRRSNSNFKTAFISEAGSELVNNDYFGFVELDDYACYVIADGLTSQVESEGARRAIESIIIHFQDNPSMSRRSLLRYLHAANRELLAASRFYHYKASVLIVVTDYEKMRYASAGNARLRIYHEGNFRARSLDMSLSQEMVDKGELRPDLLRRHEERNNLYTYLGQEKEFAPYISDKFKLAATDIMILYTRGLWENVDESELDDVFSEAGEDPQESIDMVEELLLSRQPKSLGNYTIAAVFVNKIFVDPNRERRRKLYIKIAVILLIILLIVGIICWIYQSRRQSKIEKMNTGIDRTVTCIQDDNFVRAALECKQALEQAESLGDKEKITLLENYQRLIESVAAADASYWSGQYDEAYLAYETAQKRSEDADLLGTKYIEKRLDTVEEMLQVEEFINSGDKLAEAGNVKKAEEAYVKARSLAVKMHSAAGKQQANDALEKLYNDTAEKDKKVVSQQVADLMDMGAKLQAGGDLAGAEEKYLAAKKSAAIGGDETGRKDAMAALEALQDAKIKAAEDMKKGAMEEAAKTAGVAELLGKGDQAFANADYIAAGAFYQTVLEKAMEQNDAAQVTIANERLQAVAGKKKELEISVGKAAEAEAAGAEFYQEKEYQKAKASYIKALSQYRALGNKEKVEEISQILDLIETDAAIYEVAPN